MASSAVLPKAKIFTMKTKASTSLLLAALLLAGARMPLQAQNYSIAWLKIAGGGGTSSGGTYSVSGTIGQQDASAQTLAGGGYSLTGGFWAYLGVLQTTGAPNLAISRNGPNSVVISWPNVGTYVLQQNSNLAGGSWTASGYTVTTANGTNTATIVPPVGNLYFRLKAE